MRVDLRHSWLTATFCLLLLGQFAVAQSQPASNPGSRGFQANRQKAAQLSGKTTLLKQFNDSLQALAQEVAPAVVQIEVSGFGPVEEKDSDTVLIGRQTSLGSGVIVDSDGYIITNAHVVEGAQRIRVLLTPPQDANASGGAIKKTEYSATLLGVHKDTDLALLKIDASGLPFLPIGANRAVHKGELVIALGSPEGLENSVTMGIVSAVDRQPDPHLPMLYLQTDAPINRGNSGGPLVDMDGYLIGINTFIFSSSGGSEGLGFAIPAKVVQFVFERLRKQGHVDRSEIGATAEAITPLLAAGLNLPVDTGVIISDVTPGGPAEAAGMKVEDIVLSVDGKPIKALPMLDASLYLHATDQAMTVEVLREKTKLTLHIPVIAEKHDVDRLLDLVDPRENLVPRLGVLGFEINDKIREMLPDLRVKSGVIVVARTAYAGSTDAELKPGDVIHAFNGTPVTSLEDLRGDMRRLRSGDPVVLQIERDGRFDFIPFEVD